MTPSTIAKCIAPSVQLWSLKDSKCLVNSVGLSAKAIEEVTKGRPHGDCAFLVDSPQQILVYRKSRTNVQPSKAGTAVYSKSLKATAIAAAKSYRSPPSIRYELKDAVSGKDHEEAARVFENVLLEDKPASSELDSFAEWKLDIAGNVQQ